MNAYVSGHLWDMFYDSKTQLILFIDQQKGTQKVTWAIFRSDEKKVKISIEKLVLNFL